ncbi:thermonuclease family protein [Neisseria weaveri]|uniref:thermonuclease family protein n=1 Tax=Neisseria weaveri TaxID=28091 RepID=UPI000D31D939|nr:thermonuclease family protein [Neisseria weaveri]
MTRQTAFLLLLCCFTAGNLHADDLFSWWQSYRNTAKPAGQKQRNEFYVRYYEGVVTAVSDGDTLRMTDTHGRKHKIRLAYIDAPELQQAHGQAARRVLEKAVWGQTAEVRIFDIDRYGREVAQVWVQRQDVNLMQIQQGYAWHYASIAKRRQHKQDFAAYAYAEAVARNQRLGLWRDREPQAPWAFRKAERERSNRFFLW